MKVAMFQQAPYRFLPEDFEKNWSPAVTMPYRQLADAQGITATFHEMLDELLLGARSGFDGVVLTEHGQAAYDITPNPSLPAAVLANTLRAEDLDAALIVLGRSLGKTREPLRIAEEYAMLDVMSDGRLVAAFPLLTWFGVRMGGAGIFDRFWELCEAKGKEVNPHRVAVVQVCAVAETDERAEAEYGPWLEKGFRHGPGGLAPHLFLQPGYVPLRGLRGMLRNTGDPGIIARLKTVEFEELQREGCVIVGSP